MGIWKIIALGAAVFAAAFEVVAGEAVSPEIFLRPQEAAAQSIVKTRPNDPYNTAKPWTFWWIMGSSMNPQDIAAQLEMMRKAGIGGVHIIPIYGEKGDEKNYIPFLSPKWMEMLECVGREASARGMGVDMTFGTGWPFGGPDVTTETSAKKILPNGECVPTMQKVKRAAPGGEGLVIDPFSPKAMRLYAEKFYAAFAPLKAEGKMPVRAFYNDSYEIFGANWTPDFYREFSARRGYDLKPRFGVLFAKNPPPEFPRIFQDYAKTISELLLEGMNDEFAAASRKMGALSRNQAHGSPGNILDIYASADIPETESFGSSAFDIPHVRVDADYEEARYGRPSVLMMKFASSAAAVEGKPLVSSETCTWLANHFKVALSQVKPQVDELFAAGINHIFFHGSTYSPPSKPFPGRLFYASTNFNYNAHFFPFMPQFCEYVRRCQTILQNTRPDNDILLYFPAEEFWREKSGESLLLSFNVHHSKTWMPRAPAFDALAKSLLNGGWQFDYFSEKQLGEFSASGGKIKTRGGEYKVVLIPDVDSLPIGVFRSLKRLAESGATIIFDKKIPRAVSGFSENSAHENEAERIADELEKLPNVKVGGALAELEKSGVHPEDLGARGLALCRRAGGDGSVFYFVANLAQKFSRGEVSVNAVGKYLYFYDPLSGRAGLLDSRREGGRTFFELSLPSGASCFIISTDAEKIPNAEKKSFSKEKISRPISGEWKLDFIEGAPALPKPRILARPQSWTDSSDEASLYFSGLGCYSATFEVSDPNGRYALDLGEVRDAATVFVNGVEIGKAWCAPFVLDIPRGVLKKKNTLEIFVRNCSFNRVIKLDRDKVPWRNFREINFVDIKYKPFDASSKLPEPSGLVGDVNLIQYL